MGVQVEYRWVPSHEGVEGNEEADEAAKKAAVNEEEGILRLQDRYKGWSMAKVHVEHVNLHSSRAGGAMVAHPSSTGKVLGSTPGQSIHFLVSTVQRRVTKAKWTDRELVEGKVQQQEYGIQAVFLSGQAGLSGGFQMRAGLGLQAAWRPAGFSWRPAGFSCRN